MATSGSRRAIIAAMLANAGIAVAKFVAYLFTGSASMLAESRFLLRRAVPLTLLIYLEPEMWDPEHPESVDSSAQH